MSRLPSYERRRAQAGIAPTKSVSRVAHRLRQLAAAFASVSFGALAADDEAKAARKQANETYKADKKACEAMKGKEEKDCMKQAKAKHDQAIAAVKGMKKEKK